MKPERRSRSPPRRHVPRRARPRRSPHSKGRGSGGLLSRGAPRAGVSREPPPGPGPRPVAPRRGAVGAQLTGMSAAPGSPFLARSRRPRSPGCSGRPAVLSPGAERRAGPAGPPPPRGRRRRLLMGLQQPRSSSPPRGRCLPDLRKRHRAVSPHVT